jgi:hypothetical protein
LDVSDHWQALESLLRVVDASEPKEALFEKDEADDAMEVDKENTGDQSDGDGSDDDSDESDRDEEEEEAEGGEKETKANGMTAKEKEMEKESRPRVKKEDSGAMPFTVFKAFLRFGRALIVCVESDEDSESEFESESDSLPPPTDEEMLRADAKLAEMFKRIKERMSQKKGESSPKISGKCPSRIPAPAYRPAAEEMNLLHFRFKALDLIEIFLRKQYLALSFSLSLCVCVLSHTADVSFMSDLVRSLTDRRPSNPLVLQLPLRLLKAAASVESVSLPSFALIFVYMICTAY